MSPKSLRDLDQVKSLLEGEDDLQKINKLLQNQSGIIKFFRSRQELKEFRVFLDDVSLELVKNRDLGDFQTPINLTDRICEFLLTNDYNPNVILEPTCGTGNFIISALKIFPSLDYIYCVDTQTQHEWSFKLNIYNRSIEKKNVIIEFQRDNIFTHEYSEEFKRFIAKPGIYILILGNPPWITSSELSTLQSANVPSKINIKGDKGIEALTGKGNFDIAESILLQMIQRFSGLNGTIAMLCKTSVIKNLVRDARRLKLDISNIRAVLIDAKKEFGINADGALFLADFGLGDNQVCTKFTLDPSSKGRTRFGWVADKFASNIELYQDYHYIDGKSPLEWRQGVKHDAAKVMVLKTTTPGQLMNGFQEKIDIERNLVYPFIKGSELRKNVIQTTNHHVIITQSSLKEDTDYISSKYPKLWEYLLAHAPILDGRKSRIYNKRPRFSIFGIGDYSFKPYKVAIAGFYKSPKFALVFPIDGKPAMLDDTSYFLSFSALNDAFFTWLILNMDNVKNFLSAVVFLDSKRPFTKEVLMRIDLLRFIKKIRYDEVLNFYSRHLKTSLEYQIKKEEFLRFKKNLLP